MIDILKRALAGVLSAALVIGLGVPAAGEDAQTKSPGDGLAKRQVENLDRGLVAVHTWEGVYLSWRFLGTDADETGFDVYRDGVKITESPITDSTNYLDADGQADSVYEVHAVLNGADIEISESVNVNADNYFDIPLQRPKPGVLNDGTEYTYAPGDGSCGDLDGDGEYEIVMKWDPSNSGDNMADGFRGNVYLDAYKFDGTLLWRIDLGKNIRAGQHYTPFLVYDFDGDGYAEVVCKTTDGTVDGMGAVIGDAEADWRGPNGEIITGPEYLTLFDGFTGEALDTVDYEVAREDTNLWGDNFGNRSERYLAAVAYLNGETPSIVMCRGYYARTALSAWDVEDKKLVKRWIFDSADEGYAAYAGQGNHNLAVADADGDGYDEIVYGSCTIDHDGTGLYTTGLGHGDALHVGDFDPERKGLEVFSVHEHDPYGASLRAAEDGSILFRHEAAGDTGRGIAGNFTPDNPGAEFAHSSSDGLFNVKGEEIGKWSDITKWSQNFAIYWDGNLEREAMDRTVIEGYNGRVLNANGVYSINSSKSNCILSADLFGDWREEVIWPSYESDALRVFTTTFRTEYRIATLMHDTQYRCQVASQNVGYNQPPNTSYFLGTGYDLPEKPDVVAAEAPVVKGRIAFYDFEQIRDGIVPDITGNGNALKLYGNAGLEEDSDRASSVLGLDGTAGTYAELPQGLLDNTDEWTLLMKVKASQTEGNFFTFTVGQDDTKYLFFKTMNERLRCAVTLDSYPAEQEAAGAVPACKDVWMDIALVVKADSVKLYKDQSLLAENNEVTISTTDLGENLLSYFGKSFYHADAYFNGAFDDIKLYNYALSELEIAEGADVDTENPGEGAPGGGNSGEGAPGGENPGESNPDTESPGSEDTNTEIPGAGGINAGDSANGSQAEDGQEKEQAFAGTVAIGETAKIITSANTDQKDVAGSSFAAFKLKAEGKNRAIKLSWKKAAGADGYQLYGAQCGRKLALIKELKASAKSCTVKKLAKGKYYKYMLVAYQKIYGEKRSIAVSVTVHAAVKGGAYQNPTGITCGRSKVSVKAGRSYTLSPKLKAKGKIKTHIAKFRYESSNPAVAAVNKKGKITGVKKGNCSVYVYAQNGCYKRVRVTVK